RQKIELFIQPGGSDNMQVGLFLTRLAAEDVNYFIVLPVAENRVVKLDDTGFLPGDLRQSRAQDFGVVVADIGDNANFFGVVKNVGTVQQPADAGFNNSVIHAAGGEFPDGESYPHFKITRQDQAVLNDLQKLVEPLAKFGLRQRH